MHSFRASALAHFKVPSAFHFVSELPKTATGKIQKFVLRGKRPGIPAMSPTAPGNDATARTARIRLYELVLENGRSASPFVWRIRLALAHKGIAFESVPLGFTEIAQAFGETNRRQYP